MNTTSTFSKLSDGRGIVAYSSITEQTSGTTYWGSPLVSAKATMRDFASDVYDQVGFSGGIYTSTMTKAQAAEREFAEFIELVTGVGPHGRYVLKGSGFPVSSLYQFFVEGYSNEEIAEMLNGLTVEDVAKVHAFIDALI